MTLNGLPSGAAGRCAVGARRVAALAAAVVLLGTGCAEASAHSGTGARAAARTRSNDGAAVTAGSGTGAATALAGASAAAGVEPSVTAGASAGAAARAPAGASTASTAAAPTAVAVQHAAQLATAKGPDAAGKCPTTMGRIACVDLTRQLMWVQVGSRVIFGPVHVRTGRAGYVTRDGLWHIYLRNADQWSSLYDVAMPYSQFFSGGEAFHGLNGESMSAPPGSHGCVNMNTWDARTLWGILRTGDPVKIFGRKPGT